MPTTKKKTTKKSVKKPTKKECKCLDACQKELAKSNVRLTTGFAIDFDKGKSITTGPFLLVEKIEKSRKPLPKMYCTYCPFCGQKMIP